MAGRPAKSATVKTGKCSNQENLDRMNMENSLRGNAKNVKPAYELTPEQKKIFNRIRKVLAEAGVLGELHNYVLTTTAVALDRLRYLDEMANNDPSLVTDKDHVLVRDKYNSQFIKGCNELGLSPQSCAKLGLAAAQGKQRKADPLLEILADDD